MIAYPTPTFDAKTIRSAPGYKPTGKSGMTMKTDQPEAETPLGKPNKKTRNGGYFNHGVIDDIPKKYNYANGTPLSKPDANGNQLDTAMILQPRYAEPKNEMMMDVLNILNAKVISDERKGRLTAGQIKALDERQKKLQLPKGEAIKDSPLIDFAETQRQMNRLQKKNIMIKNAMDEGFTREEASKSYEKLRQEEVLTAMKKEQQPSEQLKDLLDSKYGTGEEGRAGVGNANVPIAKPMIKEISTSRGIQSDDLAMLMKEKAVSKDEYKLTEGRAPVRGREMQFDVEKIGLGRPRKGQRVMIATPRDI